MITRFIEKKNYIRASVECAEVTEIQKFGVKLKTHSVLREKANISSAGSDMFEQRYQAKVGEESIGTVKIDVCSDDVLRVRYYAGKDVMSNDTPMMSGVLAQPEKCDISAVTSPGGEKCNWVRIKTDCIDATVSMSPYRINIINLQTGNSIGIGGNEKNYFNNWDSVNTGLCYGRESERPVAVEKFDLSHSECIYGLGEKFIRLNKTGQTIDLNMEDALGVTSPRSYKNIPFYVSTKGYGVFFNHSSQMTFWIGSMSATDVQVSVDDDFLDYFIFTGSIKKILFNYTQLTGRGALPPKWSFGYWQSKISYKSARETLELARNIRKNNIPCDVIHLDTYWFTKDWFCDLEFDSERFPNLKGYFEEIRRMGLKISLWQLPYLPEGSDLFNRLKEVDGFVKNEDGSIYNCGVCFVKGFNGIVGVVDYTNPAAVKIHQDAFRKLFKVGVKAIKTDFGEAAPAAGVYYDGTPGYRMHNLYPLIYNKAIFDVTKEETGEGVVWARSAWAGNQRYPVCWGGDNSPNYENIIPQLEGGLSLGLSGFQFWSQDIGGFLGETNDKLLIRWMQLGVFLSHVRIHGAGKRELFDFDQDTMRICRDYLRLRYSLLPYIYGCAAKCIENSLPMARALVIEYQDDPTVYNISDQYMFGDSMMIAPVFDEEGRRKVYLPEGIWTCWWTGERIRGRLWLEVHAGIDRIPVYLREGGIIPVGPSMNYVDEFRTEKIELIISLYERDGGSSFSVPVNGEMIPVNYRHKSGRHMVKIGKSDIEFAVKPIGDGELDITFV